MRVWLINVGEPVPTDVPKPRPFRTGMLAESLVARGHEVLWWATTINHAKKTQRFPTTTVLEAAERYRLCLLHAPVYRSNVSLRRVLSYRTMARRFREFAAREAPPEIIVASLPTIELSAEAITYALPRGIPVVIDVRDMWPDIILDLAPRWARRPARLLLCSMFRGVRYVCRNAAAILGITPPFVDWGLAYAARPPSRWDRDFPMAYKDEPPTPEALADARQFWRKHGVDGESKQFCACFFGGLGRQFDIATVIAAARRLYRDGRKLHFVICGRGDYLERYRRMAGDLENVIFPGWVGAAEIWTLMRLSSVGLAPYISSPSFVLSLPNKPVEYFSAGLPVITSLKGHLARFLEQHNAGLVYEEGNPDQLAQILTALDDDRRRLAEMSACALRLYRENFVADLVMKRMAEHVEAVARSDFNTRC